MKHIFPIVNIIVLGLLSIPAIPFLALFLLTNGYMGKWVSDINGENIIDDIVDDEHY